MQSFVDVSPTFLKNLSSSLADQRPASRRHLDLDLSSPFVSSQPDLTLSGHVPAIAFEIKVGVTLLSHQKPKYAILGKSERTCHYCMHQYYKHSKDSTRSFSQSYCPMDLFSNQLKRVQKALRALFGTKGHPHAKLFIDGVVTPLDDVRDQSGKLMHGSRDQPALYQAFLTSSCLITCKSHSQLNYREKIVEYLSQILMQDPVLALLDKSHVHPSIEQVHALYQQTTEDIIPDSFHSKDRLDNVLMNLRQFQSVNQDGHVTMDNLARIQDFLISKSLMDCSVMIRISKRPFDRSHLLNNFGDCFYSIGIVDVEPKSPSKIPLYYAQYREFSTHCKEFPIDRLCIR